MPELTTARLVLRPWQPSDVDFVWDMYSRWEVQRFLGTIPRILISREESLAQVERYRALQEPVLGIWAVADRESGALHGTVLLKPIPLSAAARGGTGPAPGGSSPPPTHPEVEIGWHLHPRSWGQGYATEAAARVLAHGLAGGLERIVAVTHAENLPSQRVARAVGMEHRGPSDRYYDTTCELFVVER